MKVRVKLFAALREGRFDEEVREYDPTTTVGQLITDLNITEVEAKIVFVNNRHATLNRELSDGDVVGIFPPIGGGKVLSPVIVVRDIQSSAEEVQRCVPFV